MIIYLLKKFKLRLVWLLLKVRTKRVIFWYLWNQCDAYNGSEFLSRANFILCANLSKWLTGRADWLDSFDYADMRLFGDSGNVIILLLFICASFGLLWLFLLSLSVVLI